MEGLFIIVVHFFSILLDYCSTFFLSTYYCFFNDKLQTGVLPIMSYFISQRYCKEELTNDTNECVCCVRL